MIKDEIKYFLKKHGVNILVFCGLVVGYYYLAINRGIGIAKYYPESSQTIQNQNNSTPPNLTSSTNPNLLLLRNFSKTLKNSDI